MSAPLTPAERVQYAGLIDGILSTADLATVTRKKVRRGLEQAMGGKDLSDQRTAIKILIDERFDAINCQSKASVVFPTPPDISLTLPPAYSNDHRPASKRGYSESDGPYQNGDDDLDNEIQVSPLPAQKKVKRETSEDADARLAAELQAQENRLARTRTTRGGAAAKPNKKKANKKKKSASRVQDASDSDIDASTEKKRKAGGGFQKPYNLSYPLADLCGEERLPRPQVVKKLWAHIKAHELQDPNDKRTIICDDKMHAVFKQTKVDMFQMNKFLGDHLYPVEEEE